MYKLLKDYSEKPYQLYDGTYQEVLNLDIPGLGQAKIVLKNGELMSKGDGIAHADIQKMCQELALKPIEKITAYGNAVLKSTITDSRLYFYPALVDSVPMVFLLGHKEPDNGHNVYYLIAIFAVED